MRFGLAAILSLLTIAACGDDNSAPRLDAGHTGVDSPGASGDAPARDATGSGSGSGYRHTILIDGTNDFTAAETFSTTSSPTFAAYVTWDDANVYVGYAGPDLATDATDASTKWLFVYVDVDPGAGTGSAVAEKYNTQAAVFPMGFGAEYYLRFKSDGTFSSLQKANGTPTWDPQPTTPTSANQGTYTEAAFPRALLPGDTAGLVTYMIDEKNLGEATFAGLYAGNFTDGYAENGPTLTHYLKIDFSSPADPNDAANRQPIASGD